MFELSSADQHALIAFARRLIQTPSPSTQERAVAEIIQQELYRIGFRDIRTDRIGNVIAHVGAGRGPSLLFNAHMDTVDISDPEAWRHDPYGGEIVNDALYGLGAVDMKGPLASLVYGIKALLDSSAVVKGDLYLAFVVQEEPCEGYAMRCLVEEEGIRPEMVVLCEPSGLHIATGHRGRMELEVTVKGTSAHASMPARGENAIYGAARLIFGIELLAAQLPTDPSLGQGSLAVTHIESSASSRNAIPDLCAFCIDRRLTLGETEARALAEIQAIINREQVRASVTVAEYHATSYTGYECRTKKYYPPWLVPEDHALVKMTARAVEQALDYRPRLFRWAFSTDGTYTMGVAGIPSVGFGPGQPHMAHVADEHIALEELFQAALVYPTLAAEVLCR